MRIFTALRHAGDPWHYGGRLWSANMHPALERLGHEVVASTVDLYTASRFMHLEQPGRDSTARAHREAISQRLLDEVRRIHCARPIDLFLSYFYNSHCDPAAIAEVRRLGIPTVNFFCNSLYQFDLVAEIAPAFDYCWHPERDARDAYLRVGANPVRVQMGADPDLYRPVDTAAVAPRACFAGQRYCDRDRWLGALVRHGVPVDIYGDGWGADDTPSSARAGGDTHPGSGRAYGVVVSDNLRHLGLVHGLRRSAAQAIYALETHRTVRRLRSHARGRADDLGRLFSTYAVTLNFSNVWADGRSGSRLIPHVRLRDFEAPMARACYLTGHFDEIAEFYELGSEIDTYRTREELVDKTRFYLAHADAAERVRQAGYRRARRDHTWVRRFEQLFARIGLGSAAARPMAVAVH